MTEYIIIVALIAIAAIGVYSWLGGTVRNQTAAIAHEVAGTASGTEITAAATSATSASTAADARKTLSTYNTGNQ
jgi:Flp pilus assembly pilin Flp